MTSCLKTRVIIRLSSYKRYAYSIGVLLYETNLADAKQSTREADSAGYNIRFTLPVIGQNPVSMTIISENCASFKKDLNVVPS